MLWRFCYGFLALTLVVSIGSVGRSHAHTNVDGPIAQHDVSVAQLEDNTFAVDFEVVMDLEGLVDIQFTSERLDIVGGNNRAEHLSVHRGQVLSHRWVIHAPDSGFYLFEITVDLIEGGDDQTARSHTYSYYVDVSRTGLVSASDRPSAKYTHCSSNRTSGIVGISDLLRHFGC